MVGESGTALEVNYLPPTIPIWLPVGPVIAATNASKVVEANPITVRSFAYKTFAIPSSNFLQRRGSLFADETEPVISFDAQMK